MKIRTAEWNEPARRHESAAQYQRGWHFNPLPRPPLYNVAAMILIPIDTSVRLRRQPTANHLLIAANVVIFLFTHAVGGAFGAAIQDYWTLDAARPLLWQYVTYQFLHGDAAHLVGNMLFLWVFGNAVCDRMGGLPYLFFYLAGGVFAAIVFTLTADNPMVGASGAIAAVTTAFLVLYPKVDIHMLLWVFVIMQRFLLPSTVLIVLKIILWDNILSPALERGPMSNVAYSAHLGGYAFGFVVSALLLFSNALPRSAYDLAGVWNQWRRKARISDLDREGAVRRSAGGPVEWAPPSRAESLREEVRAFLENGDVESATQSYLALLREQPTAVLSKTDQLRLANYASAAGAYPVAVRLYHDFTQAYPTAAETPQVLLVLGVLYHRQLNDRATAERYLLAAIDRLPPGGDVLRAQEELAAVRTMP
ncbi:MAG: rhomboid family intramembrane serine protease [Phycisphaerae bacterium]|nr:rhomboid family intramembrane serine protease [Phycisphaerae bacterium]